MYLEKPKCLEYDLKSQDIYLEKPVRGLGAHIIEYDYLVSS
jgi:hypothetical protein